MSVFMLVVGSCFPSWETIFVDISFALEVSRPSWLNELQILADLFISTETGKFTYDDNDVRAGKGIPRTSS